MTPDPILQRALDECMREPIHLSGAIQPHGVLLVYERHSQRIIAASQNAAALFAVDRLVDLPVSDVLDPAALASLDAMVLRGQARASSQFIAQANVGQWGSVHDVSAHLAGDLVHVELEPMSAHSTGNPPGAHAMAAALEGIASGQDFFQAVAAQVRDLVGYDRVMIYRFLHDYSGEVIAEACTADMSPYLGLRYPASDIPAQARALYLHNRIRVIPDVGYGPVPVVQSEYFDGPLDMSYDVLRSVSPVHVEYLRNMGIAASMSVSLIVEGRLWGLIACHHRTPRLVPARQRTVLDMFGRHVSLILGARDLRESGERLALARERCDRLEDRLSGVEDAGEDLRAAADDLLAALPGDGCALLWGGRWLTGGCVPDADVLAQALAWARVHAAGQMASTAAAADWRQAPCAGAGCGVLAVRMPNAGDNWLFVFRQEQRDQVRWAGRPDRAFQLDASTLKIGPRTSFEAWEEQIAGLALPWTDDDQRIVSRVRLVLRRYLPSPRAPARHAAPETAVLEWDAQDQAARLRRLAALLEDSGTPLDRRRLDQVEQLLTELELGLDTMPAPV